jgi:hypothetical protein
MKPHYYYHIHSTLSRQLEQDIFLLTASMAFRLLHSSDVLSFPLEANRRFEACRMKEKGEEYKEQGRW